MAIIIYTTDEAPQFRLIWSRGFAHPVHYVWYGDITHDGLSELVVVSAGGVHVMQVQLAHYIRCRCIQYMYIGAGFLSAVRPV